MLADRAEVSGHERHDHGIRFVLERRDGVGGGYRSGDDDGGGAAGAGDQDCDAHGRARRDSVVDDERGAAVRGGVVGGRGAGR